MTNWAMQLQARIRELVADSPDCKMAAMEAMREQIEVDKAQHEDLRTVRSSGIFFQGVGDCDPRLEPVPFFYFSAYAYCFCATLLFVLLDGQSLYVQRCW